jgi:hypothetical protein
MSDTSTVKVDAKHESWVNSKWRPVMGWLYMATCGFDFIVAPILWAVVQSAVNGQVTQWNPITLQGAGLYHVAMGAILGVAAWSRGQEKMAGMGPTSTTPTTQTTPRYTPPTSRPTATIKDTDMEDADAIAVRKGLV